MGERLAVEIYCTIEDKAKIYDLLAIMAIEQGDNMRDKKGNPSMSGMFRILVSEALEKRIVKPTE